MILDFDHREFWILLSGDIVSYLCASVALSLSSSSKRSLESKFSFMRFTWLSSRVSRSAFSCHFLLESLIETLETEHNDAGEADLNKETLGPFKHAYWGFGLSLGALQTVKIRWL